MPGVIRALTDSGTPFSILTKGTLLRRDIPLLAEAARRVPVGLGVSMAIWDDDLHAALEPGVPTPRARLDLVRAITDAGLPCGVFLAPVLPGLTDGATTWTPPSARSPRPGRPASRSSRCTCGPAPASGSWRGSRGAHPELVPRYEQLYARRAYVPAEYRTWLARRVAPLLARHGLDRQNGGTARKVEAIATGVPGDEEVGFPAGSLPTTACRACGRRRSRAPSAGSRPAATRASSCPCSEATAAPPAQPATRASRVGATGRPDDAPRGHRGNAGRQRQRR